MARPPFSRRVLDWFVAAARRRNEVASGRGRNVAIVLALVMFVVGTVLAVANLPAEATRPRWHLLVLVPVVGVPIGVILNANEYQISASILGHGVKLGAALRVSVTASAANLLPIPGSVLVRTRALQRMGSGTGKALASTASIGVGWMGTGGLVTGLFLALYDRPRSGVVIGAIGLVLLGLSYTLVSTQAVGTRAIVIVGRILLVETGSVLVKAARYYILLKAFGFDIRSEQSVALAMAAVLATALGFFPGGLGIQEVLSATIGPLVGLPASVSLLASSVDRVLSLIMLALLSGVLLVRRTDRTEDGTLAEGPKIQRRAELIRCPPDVAGAEPGP